MTTKKKKTIEEIREDGLNRFNKALKGTRSRVAVQRLIGDVQDRTSYSSSLALQELIFEDDFETIIDLIPEAEKYDEFWQGITNDDSLKKS